MFGGVDRRVDDGREHMVKLEIIHDILRWSRGCACHASVHICSHLFTSVHICSHLFTSVHICSHLFTSVHICSHLFTSVHICSHLFTSVHICSHLFTSVHICSHLFTSVHICSHLFTSVHICSHLSTSVHICSHLFTSVHICSHLFTSVHICSHLFTSVHICSHLFTSVHICPHLFTSVHICPHLSTSVHICPHLFTYHQLTHPARIVLYLVTAPGRNLNSPSDSLPLRLKLDRSVRDFNLNCYFDHSHGNNTSTKKPSRQDHSNWIVPFSNVGTFTYLGGIDNNDKLPWLVWNREGGPKRRFFKGCLRSVRFSGGSFMLKPPTAQSMSEQISSQRAFSASRGTEDLTTQGNTRAYAGGFESPFGRSQRRNAAYQAQYYDRFGDYEKPLELIKLARDQKLHKVLMGCNMPPELCVNSPCQNGGSCISGLGGVGLRVDKKNRESQSNAGNFASTDVLYKVCDCSSTGYTGLYCDSGGLVWIFW